MNPDDLIAVPASGTQDGTEIRVTLARFEAKLDVALAHHGAKLETHDRDIVSLRDGVKENDLRLLALERTPGVTPKQLGATVGVVAAVLGSLYPFLDRLYS